GGPLNIYAQQLNTIAVPRPVTPAYPAITLAFQDMIGDLIGGADVQEILDRAVRVIDQDIESNQGYPIY
ncbi:MAG: ABC transporter substrate-binding protein, partial [Thermotogota bacterium]|nr:ABC transporter substrate-binding protein [Thermotogota bacterium]